jgi:hypothetical protein
MGKVSTDFKSGTSTVTIAVRPYTRVDSNIYNIKETPVKNAILSLRIVFNLILFIEMAIRKIKRKLIC